jgi:hypothetical protein
MEVAAQSSKPAEVGYGDARRELIRGIESLRADLAAALAERDIIKGNVDTLVESCENVMKQRDAALAQLAEKEGQLCKARGAAIPWHQQSDELINALSSSSPCRHEELWKLEREAHAATEAEKEGQVEAAEQHVKILSASIEELGGKLCAVRECLDGPGKERLRVDPSLFDGGFNAGVHSCRGLLKAALSSSTPCPHAKEAERLKEAIEWACDKRVWAHFEHTPTEKKWDYYVTELRRRAGGE